MTTARSEAIHIVSELPEICMHDVLNILRGIRNVYSHQKSAMGEKGATNAYENLQKYRREGTIDMDYDKILTEELMAKYENLD